MSFDALHCRFRMLIAAFFGGAIFMTAGCERAMEPNEVYCLTSKSDHFFEHIRSETRRIAIESGFSYHDTGEKVWSDLNDLSGKQSAYDPSGFIDLLVKDGEAYVVMLNNIGEQDGRARISIFDRGDGVKKAFAQKLRRTLLDDARMQIPVLQEKCSG